MIIELPWMTKELNPNCKIHWAKKSKSVKTYRGNVYWIARANKPTIPDGPIILLIQFYPPDKRHRDDDNLIGSFKAGRDGLADAWGVNDRRFRPVYEIMEPVKGGKVVVSYDN